jgi:hypothetical protein
MGKLIIEYEGEFQTEQITETLKVGRGIPDIPHSREFILTLPQNAKVKVTVEEDNVFKPQTMEHVTLKIDSKVDEKEIADALIKTLKERMNHIKFQ